MYSATELKCRTKKVDFFPRAIDCNTWLPWVPSWSRASGKMHVLQSIASNAEKSDARGAENGPICMGILVTLSLSKNKAPFQCYRAKTHENSNGHFEGPIDFFDQSF